VDDRDESTIRYGITEHLATRNKRKVQCGLKLERFIEFYYVRMGPVSNPSTRSFLLVSVYTKTYRIIYTTKYNHIYSEYKKVLYLTKGNC